MFATFFTLALCAGLNRARGDDRWMPSWLPGRALWYVAPAIGLVALLVQPWPVAIVFAAGYLFWAVWSWGFVLAAVGGFAPNRAAVGVDRLLLRLPGRALPVFLRQLFVAPGVGAVAGMTGNLLFCLAAPAFAVAATALYLILFRPLKSMDWLRAELSIGALWGALILAA